MPVITDTATAQRWPELSVLSALAHGADADFPEVLLTAFNVLNRLDADHATLYADVITHALPVVTRRHPEELMAIGTYEPKSEFLREILAKGHAKGRDEGRVQGEADAVLAVLAARGIQVSDESREHITACTDDDQLQDWIRRAATAETIDDVLAPGT